jgi:hypothetical protein
LGSVSKTMTQEERHDDRDDDQNSKDGEPQGSGIPYGSPQGLDTTRPSPKVNEQVWTGRKRR